MVEKEDLLPDIKNIKTQETYTLPSKGLVYTPEDNIPASLTLRRMTTKEDKIRLRNQSEEQTRKDLLQACIVEPINTGKLKLMDANFLLFRLRGISLLSDKYKVYCRCPICGTEFVHEINLLEVPIKYMNKEKMEKLSITLPVCGAKVNLHYPSLDSIISMGKELREFASRYPNSDKGEYLYSLSTSVYIDKINGNKLMREELENYIDNMDILDSRTLREAISELDDEFGFDEKLIAKCPTCGSDVEHGLPITSELFTPSK